MAQIFLTPHLRRLVPKQPVQVEASSLPQALEGLFVSHPKVRSYVVDDQGHLRRHVTIFIDGEQVTYKDSLQRSLSPNAEVYVMQALTGG